MQASENISPEEQQGRAEALRSEQGKGRQKKQGPVLKLRGGISSKDRKKYQKDIERFEKAPWLLVFTVAVSKDIIDLIFLPITFFIPIISPILSALFVPYFFWFLWRHVKKEYRIIMGSTVLIDGLPYINILPMTSLSYWILHKMMEKDYDKAIKKLQK